jgi:lantibiotic leader peptide-processing serine protease
MSLLTMLGRRVSSAQLSVFRLQDSAPHSRSRSSRHVAVETIQMRARLSTAGYRRFFSVSAGLALVACAEPTALPPAAVTPAPRISSANPVSEGFIVVLSGNTKFAAARIGSRLSAIVPSIAGSSVGGGATITSRLPSVNGVVVTGVANASDIPIGDGVVSVVPNYVQDIIDPTPSFTLGMLETVDAEQTPTGTDQSSAGFFANNTQWGYKKISANRAWIPSHGGLGAKVCLVDSGIDPGHQSFIGKSILSTSMLANSNAADSNGHGSHTAGTISTNGFGAASVAPDASLMTAKVFNAAGGGATTAVVLSAVQWCTDNGADVINMSLGFTGGINRAANTANGFIAIYEAGLDYATSRGVLIVASAGNDAATLPNATNIWLPAEAPGVVSVAATSPTTVLPAFGANLTWQAPGTAFDGIASYSNRGTFPSVAVSAPGGDRLTAAWPVQSLILSVCSRFFNPACAAGNVFLYNAGTSMAAPHVSGVAALIRSRFASTPRSLTLRNKIESCLYKTVDNIGSTSTFGKGRVNAYKATTTPC